MTPPKPDRPKNTSGPRPDRAANLVNPKLRGLLDYWNTLRGPARWPRRSELGPASFKHLLPNIFLIEVLDEGADFFHRLAGEAVIAAHCYDIVRTRVSDVDYGSEERGEGVMRFYRSIVNRGEAVRLTGRFDFLVQDFLEFESIYLPLSRDGEKVDYIFGASVFQSVFGTART
jgi:hypothetical protein